MTKRGGAMLVAVLALVLAGCADEQEIVYEEGAGEGSGIEENALRDGEFDIAADEGDIVEEDVVAEQPAVVE